MKVRCNVFEGYVWIVWLGVSLLLVAVEAASGDFTFLMLAGGALGGSVAAALGAPVAVQSVVAAVTAVALVFTVRPWLKHRFRSEEHTSELQSLMRISYAVFCLQKKTHAATT